MTEPETFSPRSAQPPPPPPKIVTTGSPEPYESMTDHQLLQTIAEDSEKTALAMKKVVQLLETSLFRSRPSPVPSVEPSTETPVSPPAEPTTPQQDASLIEKKFELPEQLHSVQGDAKFEELANGTTAPRYLIEVLNDFDRIAPGATEYTARPAIVAQILSAHNSKQTAIYPFCLNDDANIPDKGSPCILRKGHKGRHKDNDDGSWPNV